jgi:PAS domain S-box-containing protein
MKPGWIKSLRARLMVLMAATLTTLGVGIYWLAQSQMASLTTEYQRQLYHERLGTIISSLAQDHQKLEKTGLIEAYIGSFKETAIQGLRESHQEHKIRPIVLNNEGKEMLWGDDNCVDAAIIDDSGSTDQAGFEVACANGDWVIGRSFQPWQWHVLYVVPEAARMSQARQLSGQLAVIIVIVLTVTGLFIVLGISRTTSPISELTRASEAMAAGDLDYELPSTRNDETAVLARSFSAMRDAIRSQLESLEREIKERKVVEEALRESEEKHRSALDASPDPIVVYDMEGRTEYVNPAFTQLFGWTLEELQGRKIDYVPEAEWPRTQEMIDRLHKGENFQGFETRRYTKDGDIRDIRMSFNAWRNKDGELVGSVILLHDMTAHKRLENQLRHAQKMESLGLLAGGIAHDFNNLLTGIQGRTSLMLLDTGRHDPHAEHLDAIEGYIESATDLTKQLLGLARGGKYDLKPLDMNHIVQSTSSMFGRTRKEIRIRAELNDRPLVVEADQGQMEQVLLNLYLNAAQAMPGGGMLYLHTAITRLDETDCQPYGITPGRYVKIAVTDTGIGIEAALLPRVFDPFFTTKEKGRGTGLGLASAYGILKNHFGTITVYSEVGHGTTFNIYLPLSNKEAFHETTTREEIRRGAETILLVDDEKMIIDVGKAMLETMGYQVIPATGGEQALARIADARTKIDLVILDLVMPGMDGGKTFDKIREMRPHLPVLLSSGYSINGMAANILKRGCNGFIQKPFKIHELSQKIRDVLAASNRSAET